MDQTDFTLRVLEYNKVKIWTPPYMRRWLNNLSQKNLVSETLKDFFLEWEEVTAVLTWGWLEVGSSACKLPLFMDISTQAAIPSALTTQRRPILFISNSSGLSHSMTVSIYKTLTSPKRPLQTLDSCVLPTVISTFLMNFAPGTLWPTLHNGSRQTPKMYVFSIVSQCGLLKDRFYQAAEALLSCHLSCTHFAQTLIPSLTGPAGYPWGPLTPEQILSYPPDLRLILTMTTGYSLNRMTAMISSLWNILHLSPIPYCSARHLEMKQWSTEDPCSGVSWRPSSSATTQICHQDSERTAPIK